MQREIEKMWRGHRLFCCANGTASHGISRRVWAEKKRMICEKFKLQVTAKHLSALTIMTIICSTVACVAYHVFYFIALRTCLIDCTR